MSFFCNRCDEPIHGNVVAEGYCTRCLMGVEAEEGVCEICDGPLPIDDETGICDSCFEGRARELEDQDMYSFSEEDEEFLRGPAF